MNVNKKNSIEEIINDFENIYNIAITNEQLPTALKAKELIGKIKGFFNHEKIKSLKDVDLDNLTNEELEVIIEKLKE